MSHVSSKISFNLLCLMLSLPVLADTGLQLLPPKDNSFRSSNDPLQISLGDAITSDQWQYLHLEIDAIDVTEFITIAEGKFSYQPQEPLANGSHQVRLVAVLPDGNIEEVANWEVQTKASSMFVESIIESNLDVQASYRIADNFDDKVEDIDKAQGQGSYVFSSSQSTSSMQLTGSADFIYNSQVDQTANGRELDVNEFQLKSEWSRSAVTVGHQTMPVNSLILTDFNRRGVSATLHTDSNNVEVTGFAARTETITGFSDGLGISNEDKRTSGALVRVIPISSSPEKLIITGVYVDGKGSPEGQAEESDELEEGEGGAQAVIVESYVDKKQGYLRGEFAKTSFDFDGASTGFNAESDRARSVFLQYATERNELRNKTNNWSVGFLHQQVGQWFYSLGNAVLPADKKTNQVLATYVNESWQINANAALEENNVSDDPSIPVIEARMFTTNITYTPQAKSDVPQTGIFSIFSNASYTLSVTQNHNKQTTTPTGYLGDEVDLHNTEIALAAAFNADGWYWGVSHTQTKEEDDTNISDDFENTLTSFEAGYSFNENFSLTPVIQASQSKNLDTGLKNDGSNTSITLQYSNNDDISASLGYTVSREKASDDSYDSSTTIVEAIGTWIQQNVSDHKFGLSYFARANHQNSDTLDIESDYYQVFLGVNLTWPATF